MTLVKASLVDLFLIKAPARQGLFERKQVLSLEGAMERAHHGGFLAFEDLPITQRGQRLGLALSGEYGLNHTQPTCTLDLTKDPMQLDVHQLQGLLHVLNMHRTEFDMIITQAHVGAQLPNRRLGHKTRAQQTMSVQLLQPLAGQDITLTAPAHF